MQSLLILLSAISVSVSAFKLEASSLLRTKRSSARRIPVPGPRNEDGWFTLEAPPLPAHFKVRSRLIGQKTRSNGDVDYVGRIFVQEYAPEECGRKTVWRKVGAANIHSMDYGMAYPGDEALLDEEMAKPLPRKIKRKLKVKVKKVKKQPVQLDSDEWVSTGTLAPPGFQVRSKFLGEITRTKDGLDYIGKVFVEEFAPGSFGRRTEWRKAGEEPIISFDYAIAQPGDEALFDEELAKPLPRKIKIKRKIKKVKKQPVQLDSDEWFTTGPVAPPGFKVRSKFLGETTRTKDGVDYIGRVFLEEYAPGKYGRKTEWRRAGEEGTVSWDYADAQPEDAAHFDTDITSKV